MAINNLRQHYEDKLFDELHKKFECNKMQVPVLKKITLNMGLGGAATSDKKQVQEALEHLELIAGQKPVITLTKKAIAGFKIREGWPIGVKVTLRGQKMWDFMQRLVFVALPRVRDFRGLSNKSFDGRGNYSLGIKEHVVFPEIDYNKATQTRGLDITFTISSLNNDQAYELLSGLLFPFKDKIAQRNED
jgi:large subunit ribosomal protein L5